MLPQDGWLAKDVHGARSQLAVCAISREMCSAVLCTRAGRATSASSTVDLNAAGLIEPLDEYVNNDKAYECVCGAQLSPG